MAHSSRSTTLREEDELDDVLQAQRERYAQRVRELRRVPDMMRETYRDAWTQFYAWEPGYCEQLLKSLRTPAEWQSLVDPLHLGSMESDAMQVDDSPSVLTVWTNDDRRPPIVLPVQEIVLPAMSIQGFAYPKYEACTPATRAIRNEDDPQLLRFIQYADEPGFHTRLYATLHDDFAWQTEWYDVDFKIIALEAVWSLHNAGVSLSELDRHELYSFPVVTGSSGLVATMRHRDLFNWGASFPSDELATLEATTRTTSLWGSVSRLDSLFCSSTNCIEGLCWVHKNDPKLPIPHVKHTKSNKDIYHDRKRPCSPRCYYRLSSEDALDIDFITINQDICDILKLFPDASICRLAKLCNVDCCDVFLHRALLLPDDTDTSFLTRDTVADDVYQYREPDLNRVGICMHEGACKAHLGCPCAQAERRCSRRCNCRAACSRRGCKCEPKCDITPLKGGEEEKNKCPCHLSGWECSPELCTSKKKQKGGTSSSKHSCINMLLQKDKKPNVIVKEGSFGLGAFTPKNLSLNEYLGEYIAEAFPIIPQVRGYTRMERAQRKLNRHRKLNYMFSLSDQTRIVLDAATVGGPTRCLNDSTVATRLNASADRIMVDGDERIYFYAGKKVKAGDELLLSYGQAYWDNADLGSSDEEREKASWAAAAVAEVDDEVNDQEDGKAEADGTNAKGVPEGTKYAKKCNL